GEVAQRAGHAGGGFLEQLRDLAAAEVERGEQRGERGGEAGAEAGGGVERGGARGGEVEGDREGAGDEQEGEQIEDAADQKRADGRAERDVGVAGEDVGARRFAEAR